LRRDRKKADPAEGYRERPLPALFRGQSFEDAITVLSGSICDTAALSRLKSAGSCKLGRPNDAGIRPCIVNVKEVTSPANPAAGVPAQHHSPNNVIEQDRRFMEKHHREPGISAHRRRAHGLVARASVGPMSLRILTTTLRRGACLREIAMKR
jgi:hypothetical protein